MDETDENEKLFSLFHNGKCDGKIVVESVTIWYSGEMLPLLLALDTICCWTNWKLCNFYFSKRCSKRFHFFIYNIIFCLLKLNLIHTHFENFPFFLRWKHRTKFQRCSVMWDIIIVHLDDTHANSFFSAYPLEASVHISISRTLAHNFIAI